MKEFKRLKDPIYGYIDIPVQYMKEIIDTAEFQRLRRIIQTSYSPLYSSAVHNRFVHSMGVYHLGEIAACQLVAEIKKKCSLKKVERWKNIFLLGCLLHDVGHAPFSHTGEKFYLGATQKYDELHKNLAEVVKNRKFAADIPQETSAAAAPHEIMSAIVGLEKYATFFNDSSERSFFARCITGYKYKELSEENSLKNCFISLLNSETIDVDKLDYLIRDAYITGFDTVVIDYERLLTSLTVFKNGKDYELAYYKSAISVIENVIYAHDSERKWIQNHPVVLYESYLLQHIIGHLSYKIDETEKTLFSKESLSREGQIFSNKIKLRLMCDDDIIFLIKNIYPTPISDEYFERCLRRHPIWKSEAEYKAFFTNEIGAGRVLDKFEAAMDATSRYLTKSTDSCVIDETLIKKVRNDLSNITKSSLDPMTQQIQMEDKQAILKVMDCLDSYARKKGIECNFILLQASQFSSSFGKPDFSNTNIVFSSKGEDFPAKINVVSSLEAKNRVREKFYYLFYKRPNGKDVDLDNLELCKQLLKEFI